MDKQEIIEGESLIRKFMDHDHLPVKYEYHKGWNVLMPVLEKMTWKNDYHFIDQVAEPYILDLREALFYSDISAAFNAIVSLIKWYNSQKQ